MINYDYTTKENIKQHNPNWENIPDHPYRILLLGSSRSGKINALSNLISQGLDPQYQLLIKAGENSGIKNFNDVKGFTEYSNYMDDVYKNIIKTEIVKYWWFFMISFLPCLVI